MVSKINRKSQELDLGALQMLYSVKKCVGDDKRDKVP